MGFTFISFTSMEISVSNPRRTCKEASKSSVIPIFACWTLRPKKNRNIIPNNLTAIEENLFCELTSHRGDSGMKNSPGINIVQGNIPEK